MDDLNRRIEEAEINDALRKRFVEGEINEALRRTDPAAYNAKMEAEMPENVCCFCRVTFRGYGNNPQPLLEEGRACDTCNRAIVIRGRLQANRKCIQLFSQNKGTCKLPREFQVNS